MHQKHILLALAAVMLLCGCNKQAKINAEKIQQLSQNLSQFEQAQTKQITAIQTQLTALAPTLEQMNSDFYEKNHDAALLYHTNTLFLLLTVDRRIEEHLQVADADREAHALQMLAYHTNQLDQIQYSATQIMASLTNLESRLADTINTETRQVGAAVGAQLQEQIEKATTPSAEEMARRQALAADVAQMKLELEQIKAQLAQLAVVNTNKLR